MQIKKFKYPVSKKKLQSKKHCNIVIIFDYSFFKNIDFQRNKIFVRHECKKKDNFILNKNNVGIYVIGIKKKYFYSLKEKNNKYVLRRTLLQLFNV